MFYDNFLHLCNQKGISPSAAAVEMGFQKSVVTRWKKSVPTEANRRKIAKYFGVSLEDLMSEQQEPFYGNEDGEELDKSCFILSREAKKMTPEKRRQLIKVAKIMFGEEFDDT